MGYRDGLEKLNRMQLELRGKVAFWEAHGWSLRRENGYTVNPLTLDKNGVSVVWNGAEFAAPEKINLLPPEVAPMAPVDRETMNLIPDSATVYRW